jgi:hypothetical protein
VDLSGSPFYTRVQRLTNAQWENAVTDILRLASPANLTRDFLLPVAGVTDFTNNEKLLFVDGRFVVDNQAASLAAAALATGSDAALAALYDGTDVSGFVQTLGRRAFRRPLTTAEIAKYEGAFALGETLYGAGLHRARRRGRPTERLRDRVQALVLVTRNHAERRSAGCRASG